jgi:hypothetical protein
MSSCAAFAVSQYGSFLATRSAARTVRDSLEERISSAPAIEVLIIDFSGVEAMTISFADEFVGRFYSFLAAGDVRPVSVLLSDLNEETSEAIAICLERRELAAAALNDDEKILLGAPEYLAETYRQARQLRRFKASDLASAMGITAQNANNRLKRLVAAGAIRKDRVTSPDRGGKEFSYTIPCQAALADA